ncbi:hypothetical protein [Mycoplasma simbae]|uniref:hypothetical protein n=1 Tax=Mycoplasma simbae TaxID=36744 RepID=UPI000495E346|nr:hypothetical protein [Mycoplasma simbae]
MKKINLFLISSGILTLPLVVLSSSCNDNNKIDTTNKNGDADKTTSHNKGENSTKINNDSENNEKDKNTTIQNKTDEGKTKNDATKPNSPKSDNDNGSVVNNQDENPSSNPSTDTGSQSEPSSDNTNANNDSSINETGASEQKHYLEWSELSELQKSALEIVQNDMQNVLNFDFNIDFSSVHKNSLNQDLHKHITKVKFEVLSSNHGYGGEKELAIKANNNVDKVVFYKEINKIDKHPDQENKYVTSLTYFVYDLYTKDGFSVKAYNPKTRRDENVDLSNVRIRINKAFFFNESNVVNTSMSEEEFMQYNDNLRYKELEIERSFMR